jgi:hypothetical protein
MPTLPITRVVLYKHGVGYFEREGTIEGDAPLTFTFAQSEVSDVLKSLTVLDLHGGHIAAVNYDSTKPLEQRLADIALRVPDENSLVGLLPQLKGARVQVQLTEDDEPFDCTLLGVDVRDEIVEGATVRVPLLSIVTDGGELFSTELDDLFALRLIDDHLRRDLDYYLRTQLAAKKKESRTFTFFATGQGRRTVRLSYVIGAPVWKATYRILLGEEKQPPTIQGWAVVDNTQDEDWDQVELTLVAGLPVSFIHDLYTPRYVRRPVVEVQETTGVLPPEAETGIEMLYAAGDVTELAASAAPAPAMRRKMRAAPAGAMMAARESAPSSVPTQVRERQVGDLFEYHVEQPVTIHRDQSALVPIVLKPFDGRPVLLYQKHARAENPMRCVEFKNTTGLTLEGGPVTVIESGSYVGEAMLDTMKPNDERLVAYAVELAVRVLDNIESYDEHVHRVVVRKGVLKAQHARVQQTTYTFASKSERDQLLYLDHPRGGKEWKLFDTPQPHEVTENYWRFKLTLPAGQTIKYVIKQKQTLSQTNSLSDAQSNQLAYWLDQKYLDAATEKVLRQVVDLRQKVAGIDEHTQRLERERAALHAEQQRIRDNLQALGDKATERTLRDRLVNKLNTQEDRLEQLAQELPRLAEQRDQTRGQINDLLAGLEYEGTL